MPSSAREDPPAGLTRAQFWACFVLSLLVFAFYGGPVWQRPWSVDRSVYLSYLVIPPLVAGCLLYKRAFRLLPFLLESLELTLWKFAVTYLIANTLWMIVPSPEPPPATVQEPKPVPAETALVPTLIPPETTGIVEGTVVDAGGQGVPGALAFIVNGLEGYIFAPPDAALDVEVGRATVVAAFTAAQTGQTIHARANDGRLHTLVAKLDGEDLFNIPLQSSGATSSARVPKSRGVASLGCAVHQRSNEACNILVTDNPFFARTDPSGAFRWTGVPAGLLTIAIAVDGSRTLTTHVDIKAGENNRVTLTIAPSP